MFENELEDVVSGLWQRRHKTPDAEANGNAAQLGRSRRQDLVFAELRLVADDESLQRLATTGGTATDKDEDDDEVGGEERQGDVGDGPDEVTKHLTEGPVLRDEGAIVLGLVDGVRPPSPDRPEIVGVGAD